MHHTTDRITHTTAFVTPVVEHWQEREIAQMVHPMNDRSDDPSHHERTLYLCSNQKSCLNHSFVCLFIYLTSHSYNFLTLVLYHGHNYIEANEAFFNTKINIKSYDY